MGSLEFSRTMAVGEAERLWHLFRLSSPQDLVLEDVALARKVIVTEGPLDKMEARLIRQGKHGLIRVKADIPEPGRKRFAIAHELGHWELHETTSQLFACTSDDMVASYKVSVTEAEANFFASGLLMPTWLFTQQSKGTALSARVISQLASHFGTSFTATAIRYVDLNPEACAVVASMAGTIRWWRGSQDFESRFWITAGSRLSPRPLLAASSMEKVVPLEPQEVDIAAWSKRGANEEAGVFLENCLFMARYEQVLSLLRLP